MQPPNNEDQNQPSQPRVVGPEQKNPQVVLPKLDVSAVNDTTVLDTGDSALPKVSQQKKSQKSNIRSILVFLAAATVILVAATAVAFQLRGDGLGVYTFINAGSVQTAYPEDWIIDDEGRTKSVVFKEPFGFAGEYDAEIGATILSGQDISELGLKSNLEPNNTDALYSSVIDLPDTDLSVVSSSVVTDGSAAQGSKTVFEIGNYTPSGEQGLAVIYILKLDDDTYVSLYLRAHQSDTDYMKELDAIAKQTKLN